MYRPALIFLLALLVGGAGLSVPTMDGYIVNKSQFYATGYGSCIWDGAHDVEPCVQAAITAAVAAGNAEVDLPCGILPFSTGIQPTGGFTLRGRGACTIIRAMPGNTNSVLLLSLASISNVLIEDLAFDGDTTTFTGVMVGGAMTATGATGAPLSVGQTVYFNGGSTVITGFISGNTWSISPSESVSSSTMSAGPAGLNVVTQIFATTNTKFDNVTWQNTSGIALNASEDNGTQVTHSRVVNVGNRWKGSTLASDRAQGLNFCCGNGTTFGLNTTVTDTYFQDIGLDDVAFAGRFWVVLSNNVFNMTTNQRSIVSSSNYAGINFDLTSAFTPLYVTDAFATITGNVMINPPGNCLDTQGLRYSVISGNTCTGAGGAGIGLFTGQIAQITASITTTALTVTAIVGGSPPMSQGYAVGANATAVAEGTYITAIGTCGGASPTLPCTATVNNSQSVSSETMFVGANPQVVSITGNTITNGSQWNISPVNGGIFMNGAPDHVTISGNTITDTQAVKTQQYGIQFLHSGPSDNWLPKPYYMTIVGNNLAGNLTAPLLDVSTGLNQIIANNEGLDGAIPAVASATALPIPLNPIFSLTGTTGVTSITGTFWFGQKLTVLPAGVVTFTATGSNNISNSFTTTAGKSFTMTFDGALWWIG